jgi:RNA polymerase sigma factor (sigma-70 family)
MSIEKAYRRYHQGLYRYCLAIVRNPEDAQDALQNTMVKAMRALQGERRKIELKPWLYRIAHNESIDLLRKRRPTEEVDVELAATGPGAAETAETRERLRLLLADLAELPDRQRGALVMRELSGLGFEQIGAAFDTSPAVARQTVYEARLSLRQMSEGREMSCDQVCRELSDADGRVVRRRDIRAHLRSCPACREFRDGIVARRRDLASIAPLPALASAGLLQAVLGGGQGASGGGLAGSAAAGAGKAVATSAVVKSAATVAVVAAVGVGAADRGGLVDVPVLPPENGEKHQGAQPAATTEPAFPVTTRRGSSGDEQSRASRLHRRVRADAKAQANMREDRSAMATPASGNSSDTDATHGHGRPDALPTASDHGQQTATAHRSVPGGRSNGQSQSKPQGKQPTGHGQRSPSPKPSSKAQGPRPHLSPIGVWPDKALAAPFHPSESANQGAPRASARQPKEAR